MNLRKLEILNWEHQAVLQLTAIKARLLKFEGLSELIGNDILRIDVSLNDTIAEDWNTINH